ncbi:MAG: S-adenosylmethionine:tRNA ribosyltransferase-isomerase [Phycisphaerales bacterium]
MQTKLLDFELPRELIAVEPALPRVAAKLLVCSRSDPARIEHRRITELPTLLESGDRLVFNSTRVLPARLRGVNRETGGKAEGLFLQEDAPVEGKLRWRVLLKARRAKVGRRYGLTARDDTQTRIEIELLEPMADEPGGWHVEVVDWAGELFDTHGILERCGLTPLPPYILGARKDRGIEHTDAEDRDWYQTEMARDAVGEGESGSHVDGSVAAPTAGLHFTTKLLKRLDEGGIHRSEVTLHVGAGTFKTIETDEIEAHPMHAELCSLAPSGGEALAHAADAGRPGRVIPVGSTSARTLESFSRARADGADQADWMSTRLLITPGYEWQVADGLLTNFHLPRSTLLAMVASLLGPDESGVERLRALYAQAVEHQYRFYSYGDAMLILP